MLAVWGDGGPNVPRKPPLKILLGHEIFSEETGKSSQLTIETGGGGRVIAALRCAQVYVQVYVQACHLLVIDQKETKMSVLTISVQHYYNEGYNQSNNAILKTQIEKEVVKLSPFEDDMIMYIKHPKKYTHINDQS